MTTRQDAQPWRDWS